MTLLTAFLSVARSRQKAGAEAVRRLLATGLGAHADDDGRRS